MRGQPTNPGAFVQKQCSDLHLRDVSRDASDPHVGRRTRGGRPYRFRVASERGWTYENRKTRRHNMNPVRRFWLYLIDRPLT
jgi:hypothetical protein